MPDINYRPSWTWEQWERALRIQQLQGTSVSEIKLTGAEAVALLEYLQDIEDWLRAPVDRDKAS
jgi:hypothetical protein